MKRLEIKNNISPDKKQKDKSTAKMKVKVVNVSGTRFEVSEDKWAIIQKNVPIHYQENIHQLGEEIYVERHPAAFQSILYMEQGGELHLPDELCPSSFKRELEFWGVDEVCLAKCCFAKYIAYFDDQEVLKVKCFFFKMIFVLKETHIKSFLGKFCHNHITIVKQTLS